MARRQQLTIEIIQRLESSTLEAHHPVVVARQLGIHKTIYQNWMEAGEDSHTKDLNRSVSDAGYLERQLYERITEAEATAEIALLVALKVHADAGKTTWTGYRDILERRFPERWRKRESAGIHDADSVAALFRQLDQKGSRPKLPRE